MNRTIAKRILGVLLVAAIIVGISGSVSASVAKKNSVLSYNDIKIKVNGTELIPTDANGKTVEPFIIGGTTYLPVRAVANATGMNVQWNASTYTVNLDSKPNTNAYYRDASYVYGKLGELAASIGGLNQEMSMLLQMAVNSMDPSDSKLVSMSSDQKTSISKLRTLVDSMYTTVISYGDSERNTYFADAKDFCDKLSISLKYMESLAAGNDYFIGCAGDINEVVTDRYSTTFSNSKTAYSSAYNYTNSVKATSDNEFYDAIMKIK